MIRECPSQRTSTAENVSIWWRDHGMIIQVIKQTGTGKTWRYYFFCALRIIWNLSYTKRLHRSIINNIVYDIQFVQSTSKPNLKYFIKLLWVCLLKATDARLEFLRRLSTNPLASRLFPCLYAPFVRLYRRSDRGLVLTCILLVDFPLYIIIWIILHDWDNQTNYVRVRLVTRKLFCA